MIISSFSEVVSLGAVLPFLGALSNASQLLNNQSLKPLLSLFSIENAGQLVVSLALLFVVAIASANSLRILTMTVQSRLAATISSDISCNLYNRTLLQSYSFHVQHNSSDLVSSVTEDTRILTTQILTSLLTMITSGFVVIALVTGLFLIDWQVALIASVTLGSAYALLYRHRRSQLQKNSQILVQSSQQQIKAVQESLGGIRNVLIGGSGIQSFFQSAYRRADQPYRRSLASNAVIAQTPRYIIEAIAMMSVALLALMLGRNGDFSQAVPVLGGLALGANRLLPALQQVFVALAKVQGSRTSLRRILKGLERPVALLQSWQPKDRLEFERTLEFKSVWFSYTKDSDWVLRGLDIKINARTTVAFVGSTGSGKSTTADLILGLLTPDRGNILIDGQPLEREKLRQWQQGIAHVPQNIFLMDASIAENIAFGIRKEEINFDQVLQASRLAHIDDFIQALPAKYDTYVGERGVRLSGGQRQRIGIARALYRQASVIVFDEATSALDNQTEKEVMAAVEQLSHHLTIILIAHRLSTVQNCDRIFELYRGKVSAQGTYDELVSLSPTFRELASVQ
ncbi:MAG: ABC transporter ATP-binding protein [Cyanobacteria bacterium J06621_11]